MIVPCCVTFTSHLRHSRVPNIVHQIFPTCFLVRTSAHLIDLDIVPPATSFIPVIQFFHIYSTSALWVLTSPKLIRSLYHFPIRSSPPPFGFPWLKTCQRFPLPLLPSFCLSAPLVASDQRRVRSLHTTWFLLTKDVSGVSTPPLPLPSFSFWFLLTKDVSGDSTSTPLPFLAYDLVSSD